MAMLGKLPLVSAVFNFSESVMKCDHWFVPQDRLIHTSTQTQQDKEVAWKTLSLFQYCCACLEVPSLHYTITVTYRGDTNYQHGKRWMNEPIMYKMTRTNCESLALYSCFFELINTDCDNERLFVIFLSISVPFCAPWRATKQGPVWFELHFVPTVSTLETSATKTRTRQTNIKIEHSTV